MSMQNEKELEVGKHLVLKDESLRIVVRIFKNSLYVKTTKKPIIYECIPKDLVKSVCRETVLIVTRGGGRQNDTP